MPIASEAFLLAIGLSASNDVVEESRQHLGVGTATRIPGACADRDIMLQEPVHIDDGEQRAHDTPLEGCLACCFYRRSCAVSRRHPAPRPALAAIV